MRLVVRTLAQTALLLCLPVLSTQGQSATVEKVTAPSVGHTHIAVRAVGRVQAGADGMYTYQWPGPYFIADFNGTALYFQVGAGRQDLHVMVDGNAPVPLITDGAGAFRVSTNRGHHQVRIDVVNENQESPKSLGSFSVDGRPDKARPGERPSQRQIEFIGDSHTVGYGNTSATGDCTPDQVWSTTDTTKSPGARVAAHYDADYQLLAISGRGVVRNYNGTPNPTVPEAYPFTLFDKQQRFADANWNPSSIVISLGTNDYSTELHSGEPWKTREELHATFETAYAAFLRNLRATHPHALIVLWATDMVHGEIAAESRQVVNKLRASGDMNIQFVEVAGLGFAACHSHPSAIDDEIIAKKLIHAIDSSHVAGALSHSDQPARK